MPHGPGLLRPYPPARPSSPLSASTILRPCTARLCLCRIDADRLHSALHGHESEHYLRHRCAAPDTPISTPSGEQPIATLRPGDLVYSMHRGRLLALPVVRTTRTPAPRHQVVRVTLETGRVLHISPGHPTADGGTFAGLRAGAQLGERRVVAVEIVPYLHAFTYDVLPNSDTGTYLAAGALVGSTLAQATASSVSQRQ